MQAKCKLNAQNQQHEKHTYVQNLQKTFGTKIVAPATHEKILVPSQDVSDSGSLFTKDKNQDNLKAKNPK